SAPARDGDPQASRRAAVKGRDPRLCRAIRLAEHNGRSDRAVRRSLGPAVAGAAGRGLMPQKTMRGLAISGDAARPGAFGLDKLDRSRPNARPGVPIGQRREYALGEAARVVRLEQVTGLAVADQLTMSTNAGSDDDALLRHCLERFE